MRTLFENSACSSLFSNSNQWSITCQKSLPMSKLNNTLLYFSVIKDKLTTVLVYMFACNQIIMSQILTLIQSFSNLLLCFSFYKHLHPWVFPLWENKALTSHKMCYCVEFFNAFSKHNSNSIELCLWLVIADDNGCAVFAGHFESLCGLWFYVFVVIWR